MRLIYVAGWLRSGTTLLSRILGSMAGVLAVGEVSGIWRAAAQNDVCSCGQRVPECLVWGAGLEAVAKAHGIGPSDYDQMALLSSSVLRTRNSLRLRSLREVPRHSWPKDVHRYVGVMETLLQSASDVSGCDTLIDSSKLPPGFLVENLFDARVDVVQIVRDPRAVASSELRSNRQLAAGTSSPVPGRSLLRSAAYWSFGNLAIRALGSAADGFVTVRYEELAAAPASVLAALAQRLDLDDGGSSPVRMATGHIAVGNPSRFDGEVRPIRLDVAWRDELTFTQRTVVSTITAPARAVLSTGWGVTSARSSLGPG